MSGIYVNKFALNWADNDQFPDISYISRFVLIFWQAGEFEYSNEFHG